MAKACFIIFLILIINVLLTGCSTESTENLSVQRALTASLNNSNDFIERRIQDIEQAFQEKIVDPSTHEKAIIWYPDAMLAKKLANETIAFIDNLKIQLKQEAGLTISNGVETFNERDKKATNNLFITKNNGEKLKQILLDFETNLMAINPQIRNRFKDLINLTIRLSDPGAAPQKTFNETFFLNNSVVTSLAVLSKFKNNVLLMEYEIMAFCNNKIPRPDSSSTLKM